MNQTELTTPLRVVILGSLATGAVSLVYGSYSAYHPAGFIVAGLLLLLLGVSGVRQ